MAKTAAAVPEEQHFILSTLSPSAAQKRLAIGVVVAILVVFALIVIGPFKGVHLKRIDAFVPAYVMAMFVCDSITALLLYAQFAIVRSRGSLVVASAYLFAALVFPSRVVLRHRWNTVAPHANGRHLCLPVCGCIALQMVS